MVTGDDTLPQIAIHNRAALSRPTQRRRHGETRDSSSPKAVTLTDRREITVLNIAWGRDIGDDYDHVTTNISPAHEDLAVDFFFTNEVIRIVDPVRGHAILFESHRDRSGATEG